MTSLALSPCAGSLFRIGAPPAGETGHNVVRIARSALGDLKAGGAARTSLVFNDLHALAEENGVELRNSQAFALAQRFLLALPTGVPLPELSYDDDGEVAFDWHGTGGRMMTVTLREDGRLTYASRLSALDKDHGTKKFDDAVPKSIVELAQSVTSS